MWLDGFMKKCSRLVFVRVCVYVCVRVCVVVLVPTPYSPRNPKDHVYYGCLIFDCQILNRIMFNIFVRQY